MATAIYPDVRFGTSYLDKQYKKYAELGEVVIDKMTGELMLKRKIDGKLVSFTQNDKYMHDIMLETRILLKNYTDFTYPTSRSSWFVSTDYNIVDIKNSRYNILETSSITFGTSQFNFSISKDSNGFIVRPIPRDTDKTFIEYLTNLYDIEHGTPSSEESNCVITYTVVVSGNDSNGNPTSVSLTSTAKAKIAQSVLVFFPTGWGNTISEVTGFNVKITKIAYPKITEMVAAVNATNSTYDKTVYNRLIPADKQVILEHLNVKGFVDGSEDIPYVDTDDVIAAIDAVSFINGVDMMDKLIGSAGYILDTEDPGTVWTNNNMWGEIISAQNSSGSPIEVDHTTDIDDLEHFLYSVDGAHTWFTFDDTDESGVLIEES